LTGDSDACCLGTPFGGDAADEDAGSALRSWFVEGALEDRVLLTVE
jgi:hypothetical protein